MGKRQVEGRGAGSINNMDRNNNMGTPGGVCAVCRGWLPQALVLTECEVGWRCCDAGAGAALEPPSRISPRRAPRAEPRAERRAASGLTPRLQPLVDSPAQPRRRWGSSEWLGTVTCNTYILELETKVHTKVHNHGEGPY